MFLGRSTMKSTIATRAALSIPLLAFVCVVGCEAVSMDESISSRSDAISNGAVDTTHTAVMLESCDKPCLCTGTLVKKDETLGLGWIVTAAHCIPEATSEQHIRFYVQADKAATFGANYENTIAAGAIRYPVVDAVRHPLFKPGSISFDAKQANDIAVVRVLGVGPETPVIALGTATDGLKTGSPIVSVGYGITGAFNDENNLSTAGTRQSATVKVSAISADFITASGKDSGGASNIGDSGGPVLAMVDGVERVVGVHSAGIDNVLLSVRQSTRVSNALAWLEGELAKPAATATCNSCLLNAMGGVHSCASAHLQCLDDPDCNAYALCLEQCSAVGDAGPTKACRDQCQATNAQGAAKYGPAGFECGCLTCAATCGDTCPTEYFQPTAQDGGADAGATSPPGPPPITRQNVTVGACTAVPNGARTSPIWLLVLLTWMLRRSRRDSGRDVSRCTSPCRRA